MDDFLFYSVCCLISNCIDRTMSEIEKNDDSGVMELEEVPDSHPPAISTYSSPLS